jgi:hypothetical protein
MLVCNVSMRPRRKPIAALLVEFAEAADSLGSGNVVFATLVDDPASVDDIVDAYLGEIMVEATSAGDSFDVGLAYVAAVDEPVTAAATVDGTTGVIPTRSAMLAGPMPVYVNPSVARAANVLGTQVNI